MSSSPEGAARGCSRPRGAPDRASISWTGCCAGIGRSTNTSTASTFIPGWRRSPTATGRWCASWSRRCCAGSARCATCWRPRSTAAFPTTRRASSPSSASAPRRSSGSMCRITPPSIWRSGWRRPTAGPRATPAWSTRSCGGSPATASPPDRSETRRHAGWLMARWSRHLWARYRARAIADAHRHEPPLDLTVKDNRRQLGRAAARPRAADRNGAAGRARAGARGCPAMTEGAWWVQDAAAALPVRLLGDVDGLTRRRSVRGAGRQDRAARARRRAGHRGRSLVRAAWRGSRENLARLELAAETSWPMPSNGRAGRSMPSWSMRRARRPARSAAIPTSPISSARRTLRRLTRAAAAACSIARSR